MALKVEALPGPLVLAGGALRWPPRPTVAPIVLRVRALSGAVVWGPEAVHPSASTAALRRRVAEALAQPAARVRLLPSATRRCSADVAELPADAPLATALGLPAASALPRDAELILVLLPSTPAAALAGPGPAAGGSRWAALPGLYVAEVTNHRVTRWPLGGAGGDCEVAAGGAGRGRRRTQLAGPRGIFVDGRGTVFVAESGNHRVTRWEPGAERGDIVAGGRGCGNGLEQLREPHGVFVAPNGTVFVAEAGNDRVTRWLPGAECGDVVAGGRGRGADAGQLSDPRAVFVDASGAVFVAEAGNGRVTRWSPGAAVGEVVAGGADGPGEDLAHLAGPRSLHVGADGAVWVAEAANDRVTRWAPGAAKGEVVAGGHGPGNEAWQLNEPVGICVDHEGVLYVAEAGRHRVTRWLPGADRGEVVAGGRCWGSELGSHLGSPCGVFAVAAP